MGKHFNPLEKEFLVKQFKRNTQIKLSDFCRTNNVSDAAFRKWLKLYDSGGIEALSRADKSMPEVLPEGVDLGGRRIIKKKIRLRIENERLKKNYAVVVNEAGEQGYERLKEKNSP